MMDLALRLREARRLRNMTQQQVADASGVGVKSICSFERGARVGSLKVSQLERMLAAMGITLAEFFSVDFEDRVSGFCDEQSDTHRLVQELAAFDEFTRRKLLQMFFLAAELERQTQQRRRVV